MPLTSADATAKPATLTALRADLAAADPLRPAVSRMPRDEVEFLLAEIANGGSLWTADEDQIPIGTYRFSTKIAEPALDAFERRPADRANADTSLDVLNRACVLASRSGRPLSAHEHGTLIGVIAAGATDPEAALAAVRKAA